MTNTPRFPEIAGYHAAGGDRGRPAGDRQGGDDLVEPRPELADHLAGFWPGRLQAVLSQPVQAQRTGGDGNG